MRTTPLRTLSGGISASVKPKICAQVLPSDPLAVILVVNLAFLPLNFLFAEVEEEEEAVEVRGMPPFPLPALIGTRFPRAARRHRLVLRFLRILLGQH